MSQRVSSVAVGQLTAVVVTGAAEGGVQVGGAGGGVVGGEIDQLVLDPKTYSLMGQQLILAPSAGSAAGRVLSGTAILSTALVSGPGVLP